jgi:polar amino acid transport system substrate-binding protein
MKHIRFTVLLATLLLLTQSGVAAEPTVKICHENEDSFPWLFKDRQGLTVALIQIAERSYGGKVELIPLPWKRCLNEAKNGAIDGILKISYSAERTEFLVYPMTGDKPDANKRLLNDTYSLYRMRGSAAANWDGKSLKIDGLVGAQSGFSVVQQLITLGARVDDAIRSADGNLTKLVNGRVVAVALQTNEGDISITSNPELAGKVEKMAPVLVEKPYFLAFSKQFVATDKTAHQKLWDAIAAARESAEYKDLVKKFK